MAWRGRTLVTLVGELVHTRRGPDNLLDESDLYGGIRSLVGCSVLHIFCIFCVFYFQNCSGD